MSRKGLLRWNRYATGPNEDISFARPPRSPATAPSTCRELNFLSEYTIKCIHYSINNFLLAHG